MARHSEKVAPSAMAPLPRQSPRIRRRVAWMYYAEEMTQGAIAERLGIGRVTVTRLLAEARALHEVSISLRGGIADLPRLELALEKRFGLSEAIVAPFSAAELDPASAIAAATGRFLSEFLQPGMSVGVGWGRTLSRALDYVDGGQVDRIVSLLGGTPEGQDESPAHFAWQMASLFRARCHLVAAPAIVDSAETRQVLIRHCGLGQSFALAAKLDAVIVSVGGLSPGLFPGDGRRPAAAVLEELAKAGAVGNLLFNWFDAQGALIDHPVNRAVMSPAPADLQRARHRVLASGGPDKRLALRAAMTLLRPTVVITDELTAAALLAEA